MFSILHLPRSCCSGRRDTAPSSWPAKLESDLTWPDLTSASASIHVLGGTPCRPQLRTNLQCYYYSICVDIFFRTISVCFLFIFFSKQFQFPIFPWPGYGRDAVVAFRYTAFGRLTRGGLCTSCSPNFFSTSNNFSWKHISSSSSSSSPSSSHWAGDLLPSQNFPPWNRGAVSPRQARRTTAFTTSNCRNRPRPLGVGSSTRRRRLLVVMDQTPRPRSRCNGRTRGTNLMCPGLHATPRPSTRDLLLHHDARPTPRPQPGQQQQQHPHVEPFAHDRPPVDQPSRTPSLQRSRCTPAAPAPAPAPRQPSTSSSLPPTSSSSPRRRPGDRLLRPPPTRLLLLLLLPPRTTGPATAPVG